mgnify:CR=1 FL=1
MASENKSSTPTDLQSLFADKSIRVQGSIQAPLFRASDLAAKLKDKNYIRALNQYEPDLIERCDEKNEKGRKVAVIYLTECGAYQYLLQSKSKQAESFQRSIYKMIQAERRRIVDETQLMMRLVDASHQRDKEAWRIEREELKEKQSRLELEAFDRRWGPTEAEKAYMGIPNAVASPFDDLEDDWGPPEDYE